MYGLALFVGCRFGDLLLLRQAKVGQKIPNIEECLLLLDKNGLSAESPSRPIMLGIIKKTKMITIGTVQAT